MPTGIEISDYLKSAVQYVSGRPMLWPPRGSGIGHSHSYYIDGVIDQARNAYRKESGFRAARKGRKNANIPLEHTRGILGIVIAWSNDQESVRHDNFVAAGLTQRAVQLALTSLEEDFGQ